MSLDLRNFVNININYNAANISSVVSGIVTLITKSTAYSADPYKDSEGNRLVFYSEADYLKAKDKKNITDNSLDIYVKAFFDNKGKGLQIVGGFVSGNIADFIVNVMKGLNYRHVIIVSDADEADLRSAAQQSAQTQVVPNAIENETTVNTFSGLNEKYFISSTRDLSGKLFDRNTDSTFAINTFYSYNSTSGQYELLAEQPDDWASNYGNYFQEGSMDEDNYLIKVGDKGIEMLAAAYLSQVRLNDANTINDYAFTIENIKAFTNASLISDNDTGVRLVKAHFNFDTNLVNATRNYPGDTVTGIDMMNYYLKILVVQDLSEAVMNLLASKIKFNQAGINRLTNIISQVMNTYISNGYLNTEAIWTDEDLYYSFNGRNYLVCARNTPLVRGYKCSILPLSSLTDEQKEAHVLPPVYLLLADQTGIRAVVINGDVF